MSSERLAAVAVLGGLLPVGATLWWMLDLLAQFRLQYVLVCIPLVLLLALRRRFVLASLLAAVMLVNAWPILPYLPDFGDEPRGRQINVLNLNVNAGNTDHARILGSIREAQADVVTVLELTPALDSSLEQLAGLYPYRHSEPSPTNFGIGVLSRYPLINPETIQVLTTPGIDARVDLPRGELRIIAAHLVPPMGKDLADERNDQLAELTKIVGSDSGTLILCGDFNLTPYSPFFTRFARQTGLTDARRGQAPGISWPTFMPIFGIPIDHCLIRGSVAAETVKTLPRNGSDHYAVHVSLRWPETG